MQDYQEHTSGKKVIYWAIAILVSILLLVAIWYLLKDEKEQSTAENYSQQTLVIPDSNANKTTDEVPNDGSYNEYIANAEEIEEGSKEKKETVILPLLSDSDSAFTKDILLVSNKIQPYLFKSELIKKYVFSINDMAQGLRPPAKYLREISFTQPFTVVETAGKTYISDQSYHRYDQIAAAFDSIDNELIIETYQKYLPLFQEVFTEFSYPSNYQFSDSIKAAAAKIMQAPVIEEKIEVIRPSVHYKFADPKLEKLSALEKQMLRMGPTNTRIIQDKLRKLVEALIEVEQQ